MLHPYVSQRNTDIIRNKVCNIEYTSMLHIDYFEKIILGEYNYEK